MKYFSRRFQQLLVAIVVSIVASSTFAADYTVDKKGMHAYIGFKISHLGYSWLYGRFNDFEGDFSYDKANPNKSKINISIDTASVDSNHAERDKHLRSKDFLHVDKFPKATFVSTSYKENADGSGELVGKLTLHGVTKSITIKTQYINEGKDPWGGYRIGFEGTTELAMADFGITKDLGPASKDLELTLAIEGVRK